MSDSTIDLLFYGSCCCYVELARTPLLQGWLTAVASTSSGTAPPYSRSLLVPKLLHCKTLGFQCTDKARSSLAGLEQKGCISPTRNS